MHVLTLEKQDLPKSVPVPVPSKLLTKEVHANAQV